MGKGHELINLRVDDIALIYAVIQKMGIGKAVDRHYQVHGNWTGASVGSILEIWLCYMLSTSDHRLSSVEGWSEGRLELLKAMSGLENLSSLDFSDDRLGKLLDLFSQDSLWGAIETDVNKEGLSIYRFERPQSMNTFRLDAAPMQTYGTVKEAGLLQNGYHKQHNNLPQFKVKLCTLDNEVNNFAYPVCHLTVAGNLADDTLYQGIISETKQVLSSVEPYSGVNLYMGDSKFGSLSNRAYVVSEKDYYMMPLSLVQLSRSIRQEMIKKSDEANYELVYKEELKGEERTKKLVAKGFEQVVPHRVNFAEQNYEWSERQLYVYSIAHAQSQRAGFDRRIEKAVLQIEELNISKRGKRVLKTESEVEEAIANILKINKVEGFISWEIKVTEEKKQVRAYGEKPARTEVKQSFEMSCKVEKAKVEEHKKLLGWQVYATNAPDDLLDFESCVWKYRYQSNIESRFDDLRNKVAPLLPAFLHSDERIKGLVNVLMLALKVCSVIEYQTAKKLQENKEELKSIFEGNPKRGTDRPSATRLFNAFEGISISLIFQEQKLQLALMTKLEPVQLKILNLLGLKPDIYENLSAKIQMFFSDNDFSEI